ncbi:MAG: PAS domain S-box protein [Anaerolineae bacterium]|nr:PAS domain S-box protein [Anaerolineae bacterium]
MKILYVEDDPRDADLVRRELSRAAPHIRLDIAPTLGEARSRLAEPNAAYDLVLADLRLPDGTGLELLEELRKRGKALAVVILTGVGDEETAVAALKAGADDYVTKRKDYHVRLLPALETALGRFRAEAARRARPLRVLYAEHNAADIDLTQRHFARYALHIHLDEVYTAVEALHRLLDTAEKTNPYDVLLLDYQMPGMNALEMLKTLYQEHRLDLPTVLVTGRGDEEIAAQALRLGAANYLVKNPGYLFKLPAILENAYYNVELERERARLAESEERFRVLSENARDLIFRFRFKPTPAFEYVSPSATAITGYTPAEHYADPELGFKLVHPDDRPLLAQVAAGENLEHALILRWVRKDGTIIWTEQRNTPVYDENGELVALEGIARDITQRQQALDALRVSEGAEREQRQLAEALRDTAAALISAVDFDMVMSIILENVARVVPHDGTNIMLIEQEYARPVYWRGYQPELTSLFEEFRVSVVDTPNLHQMVATGSPFLASHTDLYPDWINQPHTEWVKSYVAAPIRSHGTVIGFLNLDSSIPGFFTETDMHRLQAFADQASLAIEHAQLYERIQHYATELEQRVVERTTELQRSEARYRGIIEDQLDLVCRFVEGGVLTFVNQTYCEYFNQAPEELLKKSFFRLVPDTDRNLIERHIASLNRESPVASIEVADPLADGQTRWVQWSTRMLFDEAGNFVEYQGVGHDITEQKRAEEQLRQMLEHAMTLSDMKSRYVSMAAHDLRNPLAAIKTSVDIIWQYSARMTGEQKEAKIANIQNSIRAMIDILNDILTLGESEGGGLKFNPASLHLAAFCQNLIDEMKLTTGSTRQIEFSSHGDCGTEYMDAKLLRHILSNLLSNATKYSSDESVIRFTLDCKSDQITLQIQDNGIGIPLADQARLFEAFHRASNAKDVHGTGLGLAIVKQSVDLHGGTITFDSREGVGTTFTVTIPRAVGET